jgi:hypothetical protein
MAFDENSVIGPDPAFPTSTIATLVIASTRSTWA